MYKYRRLSSREKIDIASMVYFIPRRNVDKFRIYPNDKKKMADLSSKGIHPKRETDGFRLLKIGQTYRDLHITDYRLDITRGIVTKNELLDWMPPVLKNWMWRKIKDVPYDLDNEATRMWIGMHERYICCVCHLLPGDHCNECEEYCL